MSLATRVAMLVVLWLLAWGDASVANLASGILVAGALLVAFPPARRSRLHLRFSPAGLARLALHVAVQLVTSNLLVAREILSRRSRVRTGVLAYTVRHPSDEVLTLMANVIALSPGTMTVEATRRPAVIYAHFLLLRDVDEARRVVARLEDLVVAAIGRSPSASSGAATTPRESP